jgi:hypothetical protein
MVLGLVVAAIGINQASVINYEGPLSHALGDADVGFPLAILATGILYFIFRRIELARTNR